MPGSVADTIPMIDHWRIRRPALFHDRDRTIFEDDGYTVHIGDLRWLLGAIEAIRLINQAGALGFLVANHLGIARGLYDEAKPAQTSAALSRFDRNTNTSRTPIRSKPE